MPKIDNNWVIEQMQASRVRVGSGNAVLALLKTWESVDEDYDLQVEAIDVFCKLALGHAIIEKNEDEVWGPAQPGFMSVGDQVRVKADAFSGDTGVLHNGRRGKIVAIRHGDIIFKSTDGKEPLLDSVHYSPYNLEKRIR
jgi:hypothetical protein